MTDAITLLALSRITAALNSCIRCLDSIPESREKEALENELRKSKMCGDNLLFSEKNREIKNCCDVHQS